MNAFVAEFMGTMLLILFGNGVVANVVLAKTKGHDSGWIVISAGWGFAVFVGAFCSAEYSGAHINPAITIAMLASGQMGLATALGYFVMQMLGAFAGGCLVYLFYREHFTATDDPDGKLACFCTAPNIRNLNQALICEIIGTFALVFPVFLIAQPTLTLPGGSIGEEIPIGLGSLG
ncbi:MAG: MIP/aquaporin family protein, partial [Candidatus Hinthialibacter sp.]